MHTLKSFLLFVIQCWTISAIAQEPVKQLFDPAGLKLISSDFSFTEGCSVDKSGDVFFTDQPNDKIWKYEMATGKLSVFLEKTGRANGTYFDSMGNLITCSDEKGQIWSVNPKGKVKVLFKSLESEQLNGPNDLWIDRAGGFYFTDPYYQRNYWKRTAPDITHESVYYLPKGGKIATVVAGNLKRPNGIVGTPDGKTLYIADAGDGKTYVYEIKDKGMVSDRKLIINRGSDGMTLDANGNIYLTGKGISIYDPQGKLLAELAIPEGTTNVCFAGKDRNILFITARKAIYILRMNVSGIE